MRMPVFYACVLVFLVGVKGFFIVDGFIAYSSFVVSEGRAIQVLYSFFSLYYTFNFELWVFLINCDY